MQKIGTAQKLSKKQGGFGIEILYPSDALGRAESGIAGIGRIDQATVYPGTLVPMHPHRDDEILTYLRSGRVEHTDSEGNSEVLINKHMMMMNAGAIFQHEELVLPDSDVLRALQIFLRPREGGLAPRVQFHDFAEIYSINAWRRIAGEGEGWPFEVRSSTWVWDMRLEEGRSTALPPMPVAGASCLLYVFAGEVTVDGKLTLTEGESVFAEGEAMQIEASGQSDLVLFATDAEAMFFTREMYSGNRNS